MERKYNVTIKEAKGTCDSELFRKMATKGDITAIKVYIYDALQLIRWIALVLLIVLE